MKTLIAGRMDGWMGIYWEQFARGFQENGWEAATFNSRGADLRGVVRKLLPGDEEARLRRRRTDALCKALAEYRPDLLLVHSLRFDFPAIKDAFHGRIVYWDIDGPSGSFDQASLPQLPGVDLFLTVSRPVLRRVREAEAIAVPAGYLAHGADPGFYRPGILTAAEQQRFATQIGRAHV